MRNIVSRIPRKLLLVMVGISVFGGGSGVAAVYVGSERLLGRSGGGDNGLACSVVKSIVIKDADRYWIRMYVTTDGRGNGLSRVKTALRVARSIHQSEQADLVQVTVLDEAGPTERARMRGRAIGAQIVYIADLAKLPEGAAKQPINAYYIDGDADGSGEFWGMRIDLPLEEAERLTAALTDDADCADPAAVEQAGQGVPVVHAASTGHGEAVAPEAAVEMAEISYAPAVAENDDPEKHRKRPPGPVTAH